MHGGEPNPYMVGRPHTWWPRQPAPPSPAAQGEHGGREHPLPRMALRGLQEAVGGQLEL